MRKLFVLFLLIPLFFINANAKSLKYCAILDEKVFDIEINVPENSTNFTILYNDEDVAETKSFVLDEDVLTINVTMLSAGDASFTLAYNVDNEILMQEYNIEIVEKLDRLRIERLDDIDDMMQFKLLAGDYDEILSDVTWKVNGETLPETSNIITIAKKDYVSISAVVNDIRVSFSSNLIVVLGLERIFLLVAVPLSIIFIIIIIRFAFTTNTLKIAVKRLNKAHKLLNTLNNNDKKRIKLEKILKTVTMHLSDAVNLIHIAKMENTYANSSEKTLATDIKIAENLAKCYLLVEDDKQKLYITKLINDVNNVITSLNDSIKNDKKKDLNFKDNYKKLKKMFPKNEIDNQKREALEYLNSLQI